MDLLEEMERQQKGLSDENAVLRQENEAYLDEVARLSAILAAREQVLYPMAARGYCSILLANEKIKRYDSRRFSCVSRPPVV